MSEWKEYTGSDEQIAEIDEADSFIIKSNGIESHVMHHIDETGLLVDCDEYFIIPDDPLRPMKIRQARTGQPVWIKVREFFNSLNNYGFVAAYDEYSVYVTTAPDWNIPGAEYSFEPFEIGDSK